MAIQNESREAVLAWIKEYHKSHESLTTDNLPKVYAKDAVIVFTNAPPISGVDNIVAHFNRAFSMFERLTHKITDFDVAGDKIYLITRIEYVVKNDPTKEVIDLPAVAVFYLKPAGDAEENMISKFEAYIDGSPIMKRVGEIVALLPKKE